MVEVGGECVIFICCLFVPFRRGIYSLFCSYIVCTVLPSYSKVLGRVYAWR